MNFAAESNAPTPVSWKIGDPVPQADLPGGMILKGATLSDVEPDGISVTYEAGVRKIPFGELPEAARVKYGYDAAEAEVYSRKQREVQAVVAERIREQERELAERKNREYAGAEAGRQRREASVPQPTQSGFNAFIEEQRNLSGSRRIDGGSSKRGARYTQGPWKGKTEGEGMELAMRQWETFSYAKKMDYERRAGSYGSTEQYRREQSSSESSDGSNVYGPYHITPGGTVTTPDGGAYRVESGGVVIPLNP